MAIVGKKAPHFSCKAVADGGDFIENFSLEQFIGKKNVIFFFYPLDLCICCTTWSKVVCFSLVYQIDFKET